MDNKPQEPVASPAGPESPQRLTAPEKRNSIEEKALADIERQEKIDRLRPLQSNEDFEVPYDPPKKKHKFLRKVAAFFGWMLLIALLTSGGAAAAWYFWLKDEPQNKSKTSQQTTPPPPPPVATEEPTETYTSSMFQLQFDHPEDWKVTEGTADNKLVGVSPVTDLKTISGSKQKGQILITIQHKQLSLPDFKDGSALAIRESEKIDYKKPSQTQRASTYISFLNYAASSGKGLDGIYVTGDNGYVKDQYVPMSDIAKSDPLITLTFRSCTDDKCATPGKPLTIAASSWEDGAFAKPLRSMLQSIVVQ